MRKYYKSIIVLVFLFVLPLYAVDETAFSKAESEAEALGYWSYPYSDIIDSLRAQGKDSIAIFSYGSLMDRTSAAKTVSESTLATRRPAIGYKIKRIFDRDVAIRAGSKWCQPAHPHARGMLNVLPTGYSADFVNGVLLDVPLEEIPNVLFREEGYDLLPIVVKEWDIEHETVEPVYRVAYTFHAPQRSPYTNSEIFPRPKYYELTRDAALQYGQLFYELWLETTYLADGITSIVEWEEMWMEDEPHTQASCK